MSITCDYCGSVFAYRSGKSKHMKNRCFFKINNLIGHEIIDTKKTSIVIPKTIKLKQNTQTRDGVLYNVDKVVPDVTNNTRKTEEESIRKIVEPSKELVIEDSSDGNKTNQLLMMVIKQNQELKERLERLENNAVSNTTNNVLQINNVTNTVYLNEKTDLYQIYDEYGIPDKTKLAQLGEMCKEKNKLAYLTRHPMSDYIKKNDLLQINKKDVSLKKNEKGFSHGTMNELNRMSDNHVGSLFHGVLNNYIIPLGKQAIEYGDKKAIMFEEERQRIEREKKEEENRIKRMLARKRDEDIRNGIRNAKTRDIEEEYQRMRPLERITREKLRLIDDETNHNPLMDEYIDEIYNKRGYDLLTLIINRKNRPLRNIDKNVLIEEFGKPAN